MKKLFLTISVLLFAFVAASAQGNMNQPGFHDLSVSAGYGSSMQFIDNYTKIISDYPSYEAKDFKFFPTVSAEYGYRVSERFAVGAVLSFQVADSFSMREETIQRLVTLGIVLCRRPVFSGTPTRT